MILDALQRMVWDGRRASMASAPTESDPTMAPPTEPRKTQFQGHARSLLSTTWANLDLEYQLATPRSRADDTPPRAVLDVCDRWRHILRVLPGLRDSRAVGRAEPPPEDAVCWGIPRALAGIDGRPSARAVLDANSKLTSHALERSLGCALPGACVVRTLGALERAARRCPTRWVAKHPLGVSARERTLGAPGELSDANARWAARALTRSALVFEPWVESRRERSWHADVSPAGSIDWRGRCEVLTDATGTPRGHVAWSGERPEPAREHHAALAALARLGYHGPVGVDAMEGMLEDRPVRRPITEINARYTFGRIALELATLHAPEGSWIAWLHPKARERGRDVGALEALSRASAPGIVRLPEFADPGGASGTFALVAPSREALLEEARAHAPETTDSLSS